MSLVSDATTHEKQSIGVTIHYGCRTVTSSADGSNIFHLIRVHKNLQIMNKYEAIG